MKENKTNFNEWTDINYDPIKEYMVSVYSCPTPITPLPPYYPQPQPVTVYKCEICGKIITEPRVICYSCRDKLVRILDIKENW